MGTVVDAGRYGELCRLASRYLEGRSALLEERVAAGAVVDGHGDLQAADVFCLDDGPRILDCLEFDDALRYGDRLADAAFLVADLERLGAAGPAERFLDEYLARTGDAPPRSLVHYYVASRAHVRVLVACLRAADAARAAGEVERLLGVAEAHLRRGAVRLLLVGGPPGSGKSALAGWLGSRLRATVLRSDEVREELGLPRGDPRRYTPDQRGRVYERMCRRAREELLPREERGPRRDLGTRRVAGRRDPGCRGRRGRPPRAPVRRPSHAQGVADRRPERRRPGLVRGHAGGRPGAGRRDRPVAHRGAG